jgi:predicted small secreted protein
MFHTVQALVVVPAQQDVCHPTNDEFRRYFPLPGSAKIAARLSRGRSFLPGIKSPPIRCALNMSPPISYECRYRRASDPSRFVLKEDLGVRACWVVLMMSLLLGMAACSTVSGVGQDISDTARWTKRQL